MKRIKTYVVGLIGIGLIFSGVDLFAEMVKTLTPAKSTTIKRITPTPLTGPARITLEFADVTGMRINRCFQGYQEGAACTDIAASEWSCALNLLVGDNCPGTTGATVTSWGAFGYGCHILPGELSTLRVCREGFLAMEPSSWCNASVNSYCCAPDLGYSADSSSTDNDALCRGRNYRGSDGVPGTTHSMACCSR